MSNSLVSEPMKQLIHNSYIKHTEILGKTCNMKTMRLRSNWTMTICRYRMFRRIFVSQNGENGLIIFAQHFAIDAIETVPALFSLCNFSLFFSSRPFFYWCPGFPIHFFHHSALLSSALFLSLLDHASYTIITQNAFLS